MRKRRLGTHGELVQSFLHMDRIAKRPMMKHGEDVRTVSCSVDGNL